MAAVFDALGSATRRRILDIVKNAPGCSVGEVARHFDTTRIAVMMQLRILERAGLLISEKVGRQRRLYHNPVPIQLIYDRWTTEYSGFWAGHMADVKFAVETRERAPRKGKRDERGAAVRVAGRHQGPHRGRVA